MLTSLLVVVASSIVARPDNDGGRCSNPDPCEGVPTTKARCWNCLACRLEDCRRRFFDDAELRGVCLEAARDEFRLCVSHVNGPVADMDGDGRVTTLDFYVALQLRFDGVMEQSDFFEYLDDFFHNEQDSKEKER